MPDNFISSLGTGRSLDRFARDYFEPRFGIDFGHVRIHDGSRAAESADAINARAYTLGNTVVFGAGQYQPGTLQGKRLLAHELTHVAQQANNPLLHLSEKRIMRAEGDDSCGACRADWKRTVDADHARALTMIDTAVATLARYDGTNPVYAKAALEKRFKETGSSRALWIKSRLEFVREHAPKAEYQCQRATCGKCNVPGRYGWSFWCIPFTDIRVCDPVYFDRSDQKRSMGLIHEWMHRYGCNLDLGYCNDSSCPGSAATSIFNADPFARLVLDLS